VLTRHLEHIADDGKREEKGKREELRKEGRKEEGRREGGKGERKKERKFVPVLLLDAKLLSPGCCAWRCWVRWKGMTF
jgi:hypothetical protein